jgi:deoxycytidine triphosphate deaminase
MASKKPPVLFPDGQVGSGSLTDSEIEAAIGRQELIIKGTYVQSSLEASSYDVRVGSKGILGGVGIEINLDKEPMELPPGAYGGVISLECLSLPANICARIGSKRALSYDGVILLTGALVDPGYEGHLLFGLYNASQRRVIIRHARKICNIVFERLSEAPVRQAPADPDLRTGSFPDTFVDRMANMEVLPWMQISERVKQIEQMTRDILDLKARYEDVLQPIRDLTTNVDNLTQDVSRLATQSAQVSRDIESVNNLVSENSRQIQQLTANLIVVAGDVKGIERSAQRFEQADQTRAGEITTLKTTFGKFQVLVYIFWAIVLVIIGAGLAELIRRSFRGP